MSNNDENLNSDELTTKEIKIPGLRTFGSGFKVFCKYSDKIRKLFSVMSMF